MSVFPSFFLDGVLVLLVVLAVGSQDWGWCGSFQLRAVDLESGSLFLLRGRWVCLDAWLCSLQMRVPSLADWCPLVSSHLRLLVLTALCL